MKIPPTGCERDPIDYEEASRIAEEREMEREREARFHEVTPDELRMAGGAP